ncbi:UEV-domain-containing protein [Trametes versicolor FP-101664 SS1]|uniref:UEV-domain-containing protein n=1 Tax=Trametes versicolor (strain FP-101664) TaxID=717944 RepID=UPI0004622760|nr:UEV-domain-containing protein [Trametes versicolor FP-101664 SS1]EIW60466.1 UEV-domain-containing protein [Trametes versicolor FP-101664 SS1]
MSKSESITQKWLRQNVQTYPNPDLVYAHADAVLARHPTIRPKTDVYTYDDGRTQLLLCLHGLLPIAFRGASYNIPIAVWVPREYPRTPPVAYVVPTSDMLIRAAPDIDISGRCLIDYLRNWERKCEGCSLVALLDAMHDAFSRQPPVYAKPKDVTVQQPPPSRPSSSAPDYAARPPPPLPVERHASLPTSAHGTTSPAPPPGGPPPLPTKPGLAPAGATQPPRSTSVPAPQVQLNARTGSPANLSTLAGELASLSQAMAIDAERLRAHQADLLAGAPALRDEMARLEAVRDVCRGVAARLGAVVGAGERSVAELKRKGDPEVDELVCSTTIVHNQLVNLVAEDNAIEDTIYHLHRALNAGRVDLERFLRTTRVLAEEQFMKRALIEKIQAGIPLGDATWSVPPGMR